MVRKIVLENVPEVFSVSGDDNNNATCSIVVED